MIAQILIFSFPLLLLVAAFRDLTTYTIGNWISAALVAGFILTAPFLGFGLSEIGGHVLVFAIALVIVMAMFAMGWIGGGDAKLFAATALWMGWPDVLAYALFATLFGGGLTLFLLMARKAWLPGIGPQWSDRLMGDGGDVPYGIALTAGGLAVFPGSAVAIAAFG